jgi:hypothetical protein
MAKCPICGTEVVKPSKKWKYGKFNAESFDCHCGTKFREYTLDGKHSFTLKFEKGKDKGFVKV